MKMKKFKEKQEERIERAKTALETINEIASTGQVSPKIALKGKKMEKILENPYDTTKKEVDSIATTIAQIKESGLDPKESSVDNWVKKELGIDGEELNIIFKDNDTPEEVKKHILEKMEAPEELVKKADKEISVNKTK